MTNHPIGNKRYWRYQLLNENRPCSTIFNDGVIETAKKGFSVNEDPGFIGNHIRVITYQCDTDGKEMEVSKQIFSRQIFKKI